MLHARLEAEFGEDRVSASTLRVSSAPGVTAGDAPTRASVHDSHSPAPYASACEG
jgi:hypothetical protein